MLKRKLVEKHIQYPIELPLRYASPGFESINGSGRTITMNGVAVRFSCDQHLAAGRYVRLVISWPVQLADGASLSLAIFGWVSRSELHKVDVIVTRHEFRTRRSARPEEAVEGRPLALSAH